MAAVDIQAKRPRTAAFWQSVLRATIRILLLSSLERGMDLRQVRIVRRADFFDERGLTKVVNPG
jgi:hypothetical protein